jgi:predicted nucleic acid-binding protein
VILFLDASAFIKLYVAEAGSGAMRRTVRNATAVYAVDLTYVEACAAFARAGQTEVAPHQGRRGDESRFRP